MPNGKVHAFTTTATAVASGPALVWFANQPILYGAAFGLGCLTGLVLTPDLDVDHGSYSHRIVGRTAGQLARWIWWMMWWPYARLIPHRSFWSHFPVLGTLLRLVYLAGGPLLLLWSLNALYPHSFPALPGWHPLFNWIFAGLATVDAQHTLLDLTWSRLSRTFGPRPRRRHRW